MKEIKLTMGQVALVDDEDFDFLNQWKWQASKDKYTFYARRLYRIGNRKKKSVMMHRLILNILDKNDLKGDHKDHNGLNNQKNNLRVCSIQENNRNVRSHKNSKSKYLGVNIRTRIIANNTRTYRWKANIRVNGIGLYLGTFPFTEEGEILAAKAYDKAAIKYHKEFSNLNFK